MEHQANARTHNDGPLATDCPLDEYDAMRQGAAAEAEHTVTHRSSLARPFEGWRKQPDPDLIMVAALYTQGRSEREIARVVGVSRQRVAEALATAGVERRQPGRPCPVDAHELRRLVVEEDLNQAQLAERFGAAPGTVGRWLAECGIGEPDSRIDPERLRTLYVDEQRTTREVAAEFGVPHHRVIRQLALLGIPRRSRHVRPPRDARAQVTPDALEELYVRRGMSIRDLTAVFGVSDEYLRKRLRECALAKRPGSFKPQRAERRAALMAEAAELYGEAHLAMRDVATELGVSTSTVREMLHEAGVPVRPPGVGRSGSARERRVLRDLYRDAEVIAVLRRFDVVVQSAEDWSRIGPFEAVAPLPLPAELLRALYGRLGLSAFHIGLLCGVGALGVLNRLRAVGVEVRPAGQPCPWTVRTYEGEDE